MRTAIEQVCFPFMIICLLFLFSCEKEEVAQADTGAIKILSLTTSDTVLKAWMDTATLQVVASGDSLKYAWSCNHGSLHGSGAMVRYMAGQCCIGLNTITCTVFNDSCSISRDINIRITSYFEK